MGARASVAVTGVGGPHPQDGQPAGTVWIAVCHGERRRAALHHFAERDPAAVCERTCHEALPALMAALASGGDDRPAPV